MDLQPKRGSRGLRIRGVGRGVGIARIDQSTDHTASRHQPLQQLQLLRDQRIGEEAHARVAAWPVHAGHESELDRIGADREHDGYARGGGLGGERGSGRAAGGEYRDPAGHQLGRKRRQAIELIVRPAVFDCSTSPRWYPSTKGA